MERLTKYRARILLVLFGALLIFFGTRLYKLQVIDEPQSNVTTYTTMTRVKAARGELLDTNGNVLVGNRASYNIVLNHFVLTSNKNTNQYLYQLTKLCREMGVEYTDHFPMTTTAPFAYTLEKYNSAWQGYYRTFLGIQGNLDSDISAPLLLQTLRRKYNMPEEWTDEEARMVLGVRYELTLRNHTNLSMYVFIQDVDTEAQAAIMELGVPGLNVEASTEREYYTKYAAHILGYVASMDDKQWEYYQNIEGYDMDNEVGQAGFEKAFEEYLHGVDGWRIDTVTADGTLLKSEYKPAPQAGHNVEVTIDLNLQTVAEDSLDRRLKELREGPEGQGKTEGGSVVIMRVDTGEILACASNPSYDPATLSENYNEIIKQPYSPLNNRALQFAYPPGSVFKISMVVAAINEGLITKKSLITDEGVFTKYPGFSPKCLEWTRHQRTHGSINAEMALCVSCNYFFYELGDNLRIQIMDETAKGFGLGEPTGVELDENIGYRANPTTKAKLYKGEYATWTQGDKILAAIGQSDNRFTPLQLCVYGCTLANKGLRYKATFLKRVVSTDYETLVYQNQPMVMSQFHVSQEAYEAYTTGMHMVATHPEGTAASVFINYEHDVACKTGTAQTGQTPDNGAFLLYAPFDDPEICIAMYGEKVGSGGYMAVAARDILDAYFAQSSTGSGSVESSENMLS